MKLLINNEEKIIKTESLTNLKVITDKVNDIIHKNDLITGVKLNSKNLENDWSAKASSLYILEEDKLELTVENSVDVGKKALKETINAKDHILKNLNEIADMFRLEDAKKANKYFSLALDNLRWFLNIIQEAIVLIDKSLNEIKIDNKPFSDFTNGFSKKLNDILIAQEKEDWILLADMIEYEMIPQIEKLNSVYKNFDIK